MRPQQRWTTQWFQPDDTPRATPRLLIEGPSTAWFDSFANYRSYGYEVAVCTGPGPDGSGCPAFEEDGVCPLAEHADAVVSELDMRQATSRFLVETLCAQYPEKTYVIETQPGIEPPVIDERVLVVEHQQGVIGHTAAVNAARAAHGLDALWHTLTG